MATTNRIGLIGGTGPEGLGLAMRFAKAGDEVFIGSRSLERAEEAAAKVLEKLPDARVKGLLNAEAIERAGIVFLTVPFAAHREMLEELREVIGEKILVDVVVPVEFGRDGVVVTPVEEGSAAQQAGAILPRAKIVSGFHHLPAPDLQRIERPMQGDVLVCGDHKVAKQRVIEQAEKIEYVRGLDLGGLANSRYLEALTAVLLNLNKLYKARAGVRIVGL